MWMATLSRLLGVAFGLTVLLSVGPVLGQGLYVYPQQGQSPQQQDRDRYECHNWAIQQTGFDPTRAQAPPPPGGAGGGGAIRGGARGAALGAVGGAIAGDAGKGAAIGAATGGLFGAMKQADRAGQQQQAQAGAQDAYNRAFAACMSGRGYTVQ